MKTIFRAKTQRRKGRRCPGTSLYLSLRSSLRLCAFAGVLFLTLGAFAQSPENGISAQRALLRVYIETGRYTEAEATARRYLQKTPEAGPAQHELAEALAVTGRYTEAIAEFERAAADSEKADKLASNLRHAEVLDLIGQEDRAKAI